MQMQFQLMDCLQRIYAAISENMWEHEMNKKVRKHITEGKDHNEKEEHERFERKGTSDTSNDRNPFGVYKKSMSRQECELKHIQSLWSAVTCNLCDMNRRKGCKRYTSLCFLRFLCLINLSDGGSSRCHESVMRSRSIRQLTHHVILISMRVVDIKT